MIINQITLSIASSVIFLLGVVSRRYGLASLMVMVALLVHICLSQAEDPFPYGCFFSIVVFCVLMILYGKASGKGSPIYQYSPYNPQNRLPVKWRFALLILAIVSTLITVVSLLLEER